MESPKTHNSDVTEIVISEFALEQLLLYYRKSDYNALQIQGALSSLGSGICEYQVIKVSAAQRPIWSFRLDENHIFYFVYGQGKQSNELRIIYFGTVFPYTKQAIERLLVLSGETSNAINNIVNIEEVTKSKCIPELPERLIKPNSTLSDYLNPSDDELFETLATKNTFSDDLQGQLYRILTNVKPANDLPIRLSPQQERILDAPLPLLLQGVAGSGKTSVVAYFAHRQLLRSNNKDLILIVAYTQQLKDFIVSILQTLQQLDPVDLSKVIVCTWRQLCNLLASQLSIPPFKWADESYFVEFITMYLHKKQKHSDVRFLAHEIHEFIRGNLKADAIQSETALPNRSDFLSVDKIPLDEHIKRSDLYDLTLQYQYSLEINNLVDDIDACRMLLSHGSAISKYDFVLVDEVQDYSSAQILLLSKVCKSYEGLLFTGDMNQILYPSYFSWDKVRSAIWKTWYKKPPQQLSIDYNYRNPIPVIEMANTLLEMRSSMIGYERSQMARSNQALTPRPIRLVVKQSEINAIIKELSGQIGSFAVIQEKQSDIEVDGIQLERCFTPSSSKGLEFNVVCLINFNEQYHDLVKPPKNSSVSYLLQKFNEVYVAITRTRAQLILLDRSNLSTGLWEYSPMSEIIDHETSKNAMINLVTARFQNKTREDWELDAKDFEAQKAYAAAGECYERAGMPKNAAKNYELAERWTKALGIYRSLDEYEACAVISLKIRKYEDAATFYEKAGKLGQAADIWVNLNRHLNAARIYNLIAEQTMIPANWLTASFHYEKAREFYNAAICFDKGGRIAQAADCFQKCEKWNEAAHQYLKADNLAQAAFCFDKLKQHTKAAELYERSLLWTQAAQCWEKESQYEQAANCYLKTDEFVKAAIWFERSKTWLNAGHAWAEANEFLRALKCFIKADEFSASVTLIERYEKWNDAAQEYIKAGKLEHAAFCFEKSHEYIKAAECFGKCKQWNEAAQQYVKAGKLEQAAIYYEKSNEYIKAAECFEKCRKWNDAAQQYVKAGTLEQAANIYKSLEKHYQAGEYFAMSERWLEAAQEWEKDGETERAAMCYDKANNFEKSAQLYEALANLRQSPEMWLTAANEHLKSANVADSIHCFESAGFIFECNKQYKKAYQCYYRTRKRWKTLVCAMKSFVFRINVFL